MDDKVAFPAPVDANGTAASPRSTTTSGATDSAVNSIANLSLVSGPAMTTGLASKGGELAAPMGSKGAEEDSKPAARPRPTDRYVKFLV